MFVVASKKTSGLYDSGFGHFTVYGNKKSANRKASQLNNASSPKLDRWEARKVNMTFGKK